METIGFNESKEDDELLLELRFLEALQIYNPTKLVGLHRSFVLVGLLESLERRLGRSFTIAEVLEIVDRFYNLDKLMASDSDEDEFVETSDFTLPPELQKKAAS
mmetsp:Transcript_26618/g.36748  ORF Transcript_26618/g.36748 Transcript_26618/m.36748 type:complete len:104 (-) Transcript_26618:127-438(-)|eukprot:CAMPEP_0196584022 /NCGR_PEP_ID=MMETSP1081-20130531/45501_1 /TAXON_ID=36882 /ORGANISM="Pyramimonas amylifera, Strain CCMP720" /LENGTH=103 /DNA_ID=CAMNT_0041905095 /DNA_START=215 /DNA_END=529 /DNA_ORIENTATION=-